MTERWPNWTSDRMNKWIDGRTDLRKVATKERVLLQPPAGLQASQQLQNRSIHPFFCSFMTKSLSSTYPLLSCSSSANDVYGSGLVPRPKLTQHGSSLYINSPISITISSSLSSLMLFFTPSTVQSRSRL